MGEPTKIDPRSFLTDEERAAYDRFTMAKAQHLGSTLGARLFELYCMGRSCADIHDLNRALSLGSIVDARIRYDWDVRRAEHTNKLMSEASSRVLESQLSALSFLSDLLAVTHMEQRRKLQEYLMHGDPKLLIGVIPIDTMTAYKNIVSVITDLQPVAATPPAPPQQVHHTHTLVPAGEVPTTIDVTPSGPALAQRVQEASTFLQRAAAEAADTERLRKERVASRKTGRPDDLDAE